MSLGIIADRLRACWSNLQAVFTEWQHCIRSRYDLERLNERDLADMGMTRTDAFDETQKPVACQLHAAAQEANGATAEAQGCVSPPPIAATF
jgi:uncharacterized protein YjiS (DUF1127 family)